MPNGFETRRAGRATFAGSQGAPVRTNTQSGQFSGNSRGAQVDGGNSSGGVGLATPMTQAPSLTESGLPQFLEKAMEPYVQRRQQEQFFNGIDAVANGTALKEIQESDSGLLSIFGPSQYHQGAATYTAMQSVDNLSLEIGQDAEIYKKDEATRSKEISARSEALMTGDPVADRLIRGRLIENRSALVSGVTKKALAWQSAESQRVMAKTVQTSASLYQQTRKDSYGLSSPDAANIENSRNNFRATMVKPANMTDDAFRDSLFDGARNMMIDGNFYAYEELVEDGLTKPGVAFDDDKLAKLDTLYTTQANKTFSDIAYTPEINRLTMALQSDIKFGKITSPAEVRERMVAVNEAVTGLTGIRAVHFYSADEIEASQNQLIDGVFQAGLRVQTRQFQIDDRLATQEHEDGRKAAEEAADQAAVDKLISTGSAGLGELTGVGEAKNYNLRFMSLFAAGDFKTIALNFDTSQKVNKGVADHAQAEITSSYGVGPTAGFMKGYEHWKGLNAASHAGAAAYYGAEIDKGMERFDRHVRAGGKPIEGWALSFGENVDSTKVDIPAGVKRDDFLKGIAGNLTKDDKWLFGMAGSRVALNSSSRARMSVEMAPEVADYMRKTGVSQEIAGDRVYSQLLSGGRLERVGAFGWVNPDGAAPLAKVLKMPDDEADEVVMDYIDTQLKAQGFSAGASGEDYMVVRVADNGGKASMFVHAYGSAGDGDDRALWITSDQLRAHRDAELNLRKAAKAKREGPVSLPEDYRKMFISRGMASASAPSPAAKFVTGLIDGNKKLIEKSRKRWVPNNKK